VLSMILGCNGVGLWNNIGGLVGSFLVILNLKWVTAIRLDFGIM
jgi:hypothetical protein